VPTTAGGGATVFISIGDAFDDGPGGSLGDLVFQDNLNPFKTTIAIPEPSTYALIGLGAMGMMALRRRIKR